MIHKFQKNCCKNCHFLSKTHDNHSFSWGDEEREKLEISEHYAAECHKGIWSTGIDPRLSSKLKEILLMDRKDNCFFIEYRQGMCFMAATDLHRIRNDNRQLKKSYRYTQAGLWIAGVSLLITAIPTIIELLDKLLKTIS